MEEEQNKLISFCFNPKSNSMWNTYLAAAKQKPLTMQDLATEYKNL